MIYGYKRNFWNALAFPFLYATKIQVNRALKQLVSDSDDKIRAIGVALQDSLSNNFSEEELGVIQLIEQRREFLLHSNEEIVIIDYGAGIKDAQRSVEEMFKGISSKSTVSDIAKMSKPRFWATILFKLIRELKPTSCLELGSCVGISGSYLAFGMVLNGSGTLTTLEGSPETSRISQETFQILNLENVCVLTGPFHETLDRALEQSTPVDFFFNDGHHDHDAVIKYFNQSLDFLSKSAILIFDDISWSNGMKEAWKHIKNHQNVSATIDLKSIGIALINHPVPMKKHFYIPL